MKPLWKIIGKIAAIAAALAGIIFVIYFWNLDQKLLTWLYQRMNRFTEKLKAFVSL